MAKILEAVAFQRIIYMGGTRPVPRGDITIVLQQNAGAMK